LRKLNLVLELRVDFKYDLERAGGDVGRIFKAFGRWAKPGMHGKCTVTFLVITTETSTELVKRLRPTLDEITSIENYWCKVAPQVVVTKHGIDPYSSYLELAWKRAREWNQPKNVRQPQRFNVIAERRVEDGERSASVKMTIEPRGMRKPPKNSDRP
jgi:hypothetical protein